MSTMLRAASTTITGIETSDGGGVRLLRTLGSVKLDHLDPFLLLDEIKSDVPDDYLAGFPDHPHRYSMAALPCPLPPARPLPVCIS